jgi:hypothetical protein
MTYAIPATVLALASIAFAWDGHFGIHDPSTVALCDGKYYTYGSGRHSLGVRRRLDLAWRGRALTGSAPVRMANYLVRARLRAGAQGEPRSAQLVQPAELSN